MEKIYIIIELCNDEGYTGYYTDFINKVYTDKNKALEEMYKCATNELQSLKENGENFEIVNLENSVAIYDDEQTLVTNYEVIELDNFDTKIVDLKGLVYYSLASAENKRFKNIDEICNKLKNISNDSIYECSLVESNADIVCDDILIGTVGVKNGIDEKHFDIQLYYIKDRLGNYYVTETTILEELD